MNIDDQIQFWERALKHAEAKHLIGPASMREFAYYRDVVPYKYNLRRAREKGGLLICWGAFDCLTYPQSKCANGHETCSEHRASCMLCKASE